MVQLHTMQWMRIETDTLVRCLIVAYMARRAQVPFKTSSLNILHRARCRCSDLGSTVCLKKVKHVGYQSANTLKLTKYKVMYLHVCNVCVACLCGLYKYIFMIVEY